MRLWLLDSGFSLREPRNDGCSTKRYIPLMSYAAIDDAIRAWADASSLTVLVEWAGAEARFAYISSPQGECYQISIEPPADGEIVKVHVWTVETLDDMEAHLEWRVGIANLRSALDTAEATVRDCLWRRAPLR